MEAMLALSFNNCCRSPLIDHLIDDYSFLILQQPGEFLIFTRGLVMSLSIRGIILVATTVY
ncbi:MAG: hypothetical protein ACK544_12210, partial [Microcystis sp.]